jgi:hypothetical protein
VRSGTATRGSCDSAIIVSSLVAEVARIALTEAIAGIATMWGSLGSSDNFPPGGWTRTEQGTRRERESENESQRERGREEGGTDPIGETDERFGAGCRSPTKQNPPRLVLVRPNCSILGATAAATADVERHPYGQVSRMGVQWSGSFKFKF